MKPLLLSLLIAAAPAFAQSPFGPSPDAPPGEDDSRELVTMPPAAVELLREEMRGYTIALTLVLAKLTQGDLEQAGQLAEKHLGKSVMGRHRGRSEPPGRYMPEGMRAIGMKMHHSATALAEAARAGNKAAAGTAMVEITLQCASCHASYRVR